MEHLPHEFKLLWHNNTTKPASAFSDCNLPTLCARCRGRDGSKRPGADLTAAVPCGFCRCSKDLGHPPYITPPNGDSPSTTAETPPIAHVRGPGGSKGKGAGRMGGDTFGSTASADGFTAAVAGAPNGGVDSSKRRSLSS
eukprot:scaffold148969_cov27-Tisochrysis_lutea.AAC.7